MNNNIVVNTYQDNPHHYSIIKIGANNGQCTNDILFEKITPAVRILFVEPVPRLFNDMVSYFNNKYSSNNYTYLNKAVSGEIGKIQILSISNQ
jgi:FkbM family methyltransferase